MESCSSVHDRLYLAQNIDGLKLPSTFRCFQPKSAISYHPFCDDFGPMNMASIVEFASELDREYSKHPDSKIIFCVESGKRNLTNAIFLLGAHMILKEDMTAKEVAARFDRLDVTLLEPYRDATFCEPDFDLHLIDCWRGLAKGKEQGWVRFGGSRAIWGGINMKQYAYFDDPNNGDLQEVVPGKFIAFKGPLDIGAFDYRDSASGLRTFSPAYYADIFRDLGVSTVIRLNEPRYPARAFTSRGFDHHHLEFEDCTCPPEEVVADFLRIVDAAPGLVAVHCHAGLGRTGTLIALWLMRTNGFTAREAMGWLRVMRSGSVIGRQQHYLCEVHARTRAARRAAAAAAAAVDSGADVSSKAGLAAAADGRRGSPAGLPRSLQRSRSEPHLPAAAAAAAASSSEKLSPAAADSADGVAGPAQRRAGMLRRSVSFGQLP